MPTVSGVVTQDGSVFEGKSVVVAAGALESPALLMRSGIGPAAHLAARNVPLVVDNEHVGKHLKDKMLLDDMLLTDCSTKFFDKSLLYVYRVFEDGLATQLHRYDKFTMGNTYLALTRLLRSSFSDITSSRGQSLVSGARHMLSYMNPKDYSAFCFQTNIKMQSEASVTLSPSGKPDLDASCFFSEVQDRNAELKNKVRDAYREIFAMRDAPRISYMTTVPGITAGRFANMWRMVWHFAGSCRLGDVLRKNDFGVRGVQGLHVVDMSAARATSDGGAMGMAYLLGAVAADKMITSDAKVAGRNHS